MILVLIAHFTGTVSIFKKLFCIRYVGMYNMAKEYVSSGPNGINKFSFTSN